MKKLLLISASILLLAACDDKSKDAATTADTSSVEVPAVAPQLTPEEQAKQQEEENEKAREIAEDAPGTPAPKVDKNFLGHWTGPEGTYMNIVDMGAFYEINIKDLDSEKIYPAQPEGENLAFTRNGVKEIIKPGDGKATGMKWLADKKDCLVIKTGEGYCKD